MTTAERFPLLFAKADEPKRRDALEKAVALIEDGAAGTRIVRLVEFKRASSTLAIVMGNLFGSPAKDDDIGYEFWRTTNIPGHLHEVLAFHKRIGAADAAGSPYIAKLKALADEMIPLAEKARDLRPKLAKGRDTSKGPATPVNPDKVTKTCPCCFRQIAVENGKGGMVDHGFKLLPGGWRGRMGKCYGVGHPCLEVSTSGLVAFIKFHEEQLKRATTACEGVGALEEITLELRRGEKEIRVIRKDDPAFPARLRELTEKLHRERDHLTHTVATLKRELKKWEAVPKITL